jgi:2-oxoisovalerate dehydrogenase E1 component alpha subunit
MEFSAEELRGFYRDLVLVRRVDVEATALQRQGELGLWASCLGQEAAQVGAGRVLRPGDFAFPTYRDHGVTWTRGVAPLDTAVVCSAASPTAAGTRPPRSAVRRTRS